MRIHNETPYQAGWTTSFLQDGRELVTVVVKGSFSLRNAGELLERQRPLLESDEFGKDPAKDAPLRENDFAPRKPRCDVLLHACAYAPAGRLAARFEVGAVVGAMQKSFVVVGRRQWRRGVVSARASAPEPFDQHRISYDSAFGGVDVDPEDPLRIHSYLQNPSGTGYSRSGAQLEGMALPRSEELKRSVADPSANYPPMAFGPIGRHWVPRLSYVGTYDEKWQNERLPFMPDDFNPLYFQAAPPDQQVDHIVGGERSRAGRQRATFFTTG